MERTSRVPSQAIGLLERWGGRPWRAQDGSSDLRRALRRGYWLLFSLLAATYIWLDNPPRYLWAAIGLLGLTAFAAGIKMNAPSPSKPWWLLWVGVGGLLLGDVTYDVLTTVLHQADPFPSVADIPYLAMYPLTAAGLAGLIRARTPKSDGPALLDSAMVTVGMALLVWVFVAAPNLQDPSLTWVQKAVSVAYPLGDVLVLAVLARLLIVGGPVLRSLRLLTVGALGLLSADVLYGLVQLNGGWTTGGLADIGWIVFYGSWGAAGLHPDMRRMTDPMPQTQQLTPGWRLLILTLVPLVAPGLLLVESTGGRSHDVGVIAVASCVLFLLVAMRLTGLVSLARSSTLRETVLRRTGEALVAAGTRDEIFRAAADAVQQIITDPHRVLMGAWREELEVFGASAEGQATRIVTGLVEKHHDTLSSQKYVLLTLSDWGHSEIGEPGTPVLIAAMMRDDEVTGVILVAGQTVHRPHIVEAVSALASQVVLALDSADLTAQTLQRKSAAQFRSLIQNSSDVIVVADEELQVTFQTPSAQTLLGWDPDATKGRPLHSLVVPRDTGRARALLRRACVKQGRGKRFGDVAGEWRLTDRNGDTRVFEVSCSNLLEDPNVRGLVVNLHDVTERRRLETELKHQAFHDPLTQLPNRALFLDRVEHALARRGRHRERIAVVLIDLDDFKLVNDTRGHAVGDALLIQVARRLQDTLREEDTCARLGGDEFAVLMEGLLSDDEAQQLAERIAARLREPVMIDGEAVLAGSSIGVSTTEYGENATDLLRQADLAMYAAKDAGKSATAIYQPSMQDSMHARAQLSRDLEGAVERDEFVLHYQPVVSLDDGRLLGVEALIRWQHPERGLLPPGAFIDAVEGSDLAIPIGAWVIDEAVRQAASWLNSGRVTPGFKVNVNIAPRQLTDPSLVRHVADVLARHGLPPSGLVLEITERVLAGNEPEIVRVMTELHKSGVQLALDDFGTGYSALSYLRHFPVSALKIDRSFVSGLGTSSEDAALVEAIIRLAQTFGLDLVAEGVETSSQSLILSRLECHKAQGYLYSPPLPADELSDRLVPGDPISEDDAASPAAIHLRPIPVEQGAHR